ncbi:MAG: hypothetical protein H6625_11080 [Bdellovibrionaceae bacterium]|nr:hypothetical protein [Pseudobdellovibrionaceae bacterium]
MNLDDLKDQLLEQWERLRNRILDDPTFNSIRERFETLPSTSQKAIIASFLLLFILIVIYIPFGYFQSAKVYQEKYTSYRSTIRELLRVGKADNSRALYTQKGNLELLKSRLSSSLNNFNLMGDQIVGVELSSETKSSLARPPVQEEVFILKLKKLNLDQILQIGSDLVKNFNDLKMTGLNIAADKEKAGYFNTEYRLSKFYLPDSEANDGEDNSNKKPKRKFQRK